MIKASFPFYKTSFRLVSGQAFNLQFSKASLGPESCVACRTRRDTKRENLFIASVNIIGGESSANAKALGETRLGSGVCN